MNTVKSSTFQKHHIPRYIRQRERTDPAKAWMFTIWKNVYSVYRSLQRAIRYSHCVVHIRFQLEKSKGGRVHIQGYVRFLEIYTKNEVKQFLGCKSAHVGNRISKHSKALAYTSKKASAVEGSMWEFRNERYYKAIKEVRAKLKAGEEVEFNDEDFVTNSQ